MMQMFFFHFQSTEVNVYNCALWYQVSDIWLKILWYTRTQFQYFRNIVSILVSFKTLWRNIIWWNIEIICLRNGRNIFVSDQNFSAGLIIVGDIFCYNHTTVLYPHPPGHRRPLLPGGRPHHPGQPQPLCSRPLRLRSNEGRTHWEPWGPVRV